MTTIYYNEKENVYNGETKTFSFSEKDVAFDTTYEVVNPNTGGKMIFNFDHSTGPEFDEDTKWIYYNSDKSLTLEICNDADMVKEAAENYLKAKLRN